MREVAAVAAACGKNIAVYQDYKGPEQVRAIYFSGTYANLPMMEGRFFQESDFTAGNRCAVVGKNRRSELVQRGHAFAIVDEVDSILIDEARTPLIISGMGRKVHGDVFPHGKPCTRLPQEGLSPRATTRKRKTSTSTPTTSSTKRPRPRRSPPAA
mgnify:CR=1 FL=1